MPIYGAVHQICHSRAGGNPYPSFVAYVPWIPAYAGMTYLLGMTGINLSSLLLHMALAGVQKVNHRLTIAGVLRVFSQSDTVAGAR